MVTFLTVSPCAVTVPSFATVMPGIFLIRSSVEASGFTLYWLALNCEESPFTTTAAVFETTVTVDKSLSCLSSVIVASVLTVSFRLINEIYS